MFGILGVLFLIFLVETLAEVFAEMSLVAELPRALEVIAVYWATCVSLAIALLVLIVLVFATWRGGGNGHR